MKLLDFFKKLKYNVNLNHFMESISMATSFPFGKLNFPPAPPMHSPPKKKRGAGVPKDQTPPGYTVLKIGSPNQPINLRVGSPNSSFRIVIPLGV